MVKVQYWMVKSYAAVFGNIPTGGVLGHNSGPFLIPQT
jgi:hypothetical protein